MPKCTGYNSSTSHLSVSRNRRSSVGTRVTTVSAYDLDEGENAVIRYDFLEPSEKFEIDQRTGAITTKTDLTFFQGETRVTVIAWNPEPMAAWKDDFAQEKTEVLIDLSDAKPPKFTQDVYSAPVKEEGSQPGIGISRAHAHTGQTDATCWCKMMQHCCSQHVPCVWPPCCTMLHVA